MHTQTRAGFKGFVHQIQQSQTITNIELQQQKSKRKLGFKTMGLKGVAFVAHALGALLADVARMLQTAAILYTVDFILLGTRGMAYGLSVLVREEPALSALLLQ